MAVIAADVNADGRLDLVSTDTAATRSRRARQRRRDVRRRMQVVLLGGTFPNAIAAGDFDRDGTWTSPVSTALAGYVALSETTVALLSISALRPVDVRGRPRSSSCSTSTATAAATS